MLSSLALSAVLLKVLSEPIPIRIDGGLQVDKLVLSASVTIRSEQPLPVSGTVGVDAPVTIKGEKVSNHSSLTLSGLSPLIAPSRSMAPSTPRPR